jgi:phosphoserine phosphatase RsbU/P
MLGNYLLPLSNDLLEQLDIAHNIQQAMYPEPCKNLPYLCACSKSLPCYEVGGDYYDYFDLDGGRFCFALGDVAGKGIPAALLVSAIQVILSPEVFLDTPLSSIITNLNRILARRGTGNRFVTSFFGMVDSEGNCSYVNAGHNPPFLLGRDGSLRELSEGGTVLGLFAEAHYDCYTVKLSPNDHLVLFTDGVVEARNSEGEEFGCKRLCELLRSNAGANSSELLTRLQEAVESFSANTPQFDDITMMILGFRESQPSLVS